MVVSVDDVKVGPVTPASGVTLISLDFDATDWEASWLEVFRTGSDTALVMGAEYTVQNAGEAGATITLLTAANGTDQYTVYLATPPERSSDMQARGEFRSGPFNSEMDRIWQRLQYQHSLILERFGVSRAYGDASLITPVAGRVLGFDESGNLVNTEQSLADIDNAAAQVAAYLATAPVLGPVDTDLGLIINSATSTLDWGSLT